MKHSKLFFIFLVTFFWSNQASLLAQSSPRLGIKAGPNLRTVILSGSDKDEDEQPGMIVGFQIGGVVEFQMGEQADLRTGLSILSKGTKIKYYGDYDIYSPVYLHVPVYLIFGGSEFRFGGGPYVSMAIGGKYKDNYGTNQDLLIGSGEYDDWAQFDAGLGLSFNYDFGAIEAGLDVEYGVLNMVPKDQIDGYDYHAQNLIFNLAATYYFE